MFQDLSGWVGYLVFLTISTAIFALFSLGLNLQWNFTGKEKSSQAYRRK
jgi:neutral amino acid transport system permease protein